MVTCWWMKSGAADEQRRGTAYQSCRSTPSAFNVRNVRVILTEPEGPALLFSPTPHQQLPWKPISQTHSPSLLLFLQTSFILPALITSHNLFYHRYPLCHLVLCVSFYSLHFAPSLPIFSAWFRHRSSFVSHLCRFLAAIHSSTDINRHLSFISDWSCSNVYKSISSSPLCI